MRGLIGGLIASVVVCLALAPPSTSAPAPKKPGVARHVQTATHSRARVHRRRLVSRRARRAAALRMAAHLRRFRKGQPVVLYGRVAGLNIRTRTFMIGYGGWHTPIYARGAYVTYHGRRGNIYRLMGNPRVRVYGTGAGRHVVRARRIQVLSRPLSKLMPSRYTRSATPNMHLRPVTKPAKNPVPRVGAHPRRR